MARAELPIVVKSGATGLPVSGASVVIANRTTGLPVTWYTTETGGTSSTSAVITDSNGRGIAWVARGAYTLTVSGTGITRTSQPWDAMPGADSGGDSIYLADASVTNAKIATGLDASKFTVGTVPAARIGALAVPGSALANAAITAAKMADTNGMKLIQARVMDGGATANQDLDLMPTYTQPTAAKEVWGIALQIIRPTSTAGYANMWVVRNGSAIATTANDWDGGIAKASLMAVDFTYANIGAHSATWRVLAFVDDRDGVNGLALFEGTGIFLLFER